MKPIPPSMPHNRSLGGLLTVFSWIVCYFLATQAYCQTNNLPFMRIDAKDGLSQNTVMDMTEDEDGFMWFATQEGLNKYDGNQFEKFYQIPHDSNSLYNSWIWNVESDNQGKIWIATFSGLNTYDIRTRTIQRIKTILGNDGTQQSERINVLHYGQNNNMWVACWGGGVYQTPVDTIYFKEVDPIADSLQKYALRYTYDLRQTPDSILWVASHYGLYKYNMNTNELSKIALKHKGKIIQEDYIVYDLALRNKTELWFGAHGYGLFCLNTKSEELLPASAFTTALDHSDWQVATVACENSGAIWVGTYSSGLIKLNPENGKIEHFIHVKSDQNSINGNAISDVYVDNNQGIWIGAIGLSYYNEKAYPFKLFRSNPDNSSGLVNNYIWNIYQDPIGRIWIASDMGGLHRFDPEKQSIKKEPLADNYRNLVITGLAMDNNERLWLATNSHGLFNYDPTSQKLSSYSAFYGLPEFQLVRQIQDIIWLDSALYIGTFDQGVFIMDTQTGSIEKRTFEYTKQPKLNSGYVRKLIRSRSNKLYICTWGGGFIEYDPKTERTRRFAVDSIPGQSLSSNTVYTVFEDDQNQLWIGTSKGLDLISGDRTSISHIEDYQDEYEHVIYSILEDRAGTLWMSTNRGLLNFSPEFNRWRLYTPADGLQGFEYNKGAYLKDRDGNLYFGGIDGLTFFNPAAITSDHTPPRLVMTDFLLFDESRRDLLSLNSSIDLTYSQNFFSFQFTGIYFPKPDAVTYEYKLDGLDEDWVHAGNRNFATYTKLDPGSYTFQVRASNPDGIWTDDSIAIPIVISPPFWQTPWFITLVLLATLGLLYYLHRIRIEKAVAIERLRTQIAEDLHDDVGASLTKISMYSDLLKLEPDEQEKVSYLNQIGSISREVVSIMRDIVWAIDTRHDSSTDLIAHMRDFATNLLEKKQIEVQFQTSGLETGKKINNHFRQNLYLIFKESINNIVKHADASQVAIDIRNTTKQFSMVISDNGKGLKKMNGYNGHGLTNMKMRAKRINGDLSVQDKDGVTITFTGKAL